MKTHESPRIKKRIRGDYGRFVACGRNRGIRNSYEYSRCSAGFGLSRTFTTMCNYIFGNTEISKRIDRELVKNTPNAGDVLGTNYRNPRRTATIREILSHDSYKKGPSMLLGHQFQNECSS